MVKITVVQTDDRVSVDYVGLSRQVNEKMSNIFGYNYVFVENTDCHPNMHATFRKVYVVNDILCNSNDDFLVYLDTDAWIQNGEWLNDLINYLQENDNKHGSYSRDPYVKKNTFINAGSFIIKINDFTKKMYQDIIFHLENDDSYHNGWPHDQHYMSNYIYNNKDYFNVFVPNILNTPFGEILRHNWRKNDQMYNDLYNLINSDIIKKNIPFDIEKYYDNAPFPNIIEDGYEYDY